MGCPGAISGKKGNRAALPKNRIIYRNTTEGATSSADYRDST